MFNHRVHVCYLRLSWCCDKNSSTGSAAEVHNELGDGDVDNNPPISQVDKRAAVMLDIQAG